MTLTAPTVGRTPARRQAPAGWARGVDRDAACAYRVRTAAAEARDILVGLGATPLVERLDRLMAAREQMAGGHATHPPGGVASRAGAAAESDDAGDG